MFGHSQCAVDIDWLVGQEDGRSEGTRGARMAKPKPGENIYIESTVYVHHGADDFLGGICKVKATRTSIQNGEEVTDVEVEEDPNSWSRWEGYLEPNQEKWKKEYGEQKGRLRPDLRAEFNDGWDADLD
jgi:hypothetical protein